jgi:membrane peptidoglycan carboxypeptidase
MPTRAWKRKQFKAGWSAGESIIAGIGQGMVLTTPLQLAVMMAGVINGGKKITPKMVQRDDANAQTPRMIDAKPDHLALVKQALDDVTNDPSGTAYRARITAGDDGNQWAMGGKTGTSQVRRITAREREQGVKKNEDLPWKKRDHALFVGYAPLENPRLVISVVIEHGGSGGHTAAPIADTARFNRHRTIFISDTHLGTRGCKAEALATQAAVRRSSTGRASTRAASTRAARRSPKSSGQAPTRRAVRSTQRYSTSFSAACQPSSAWNMVWRHSRRFAS